MQAYPKILMSNSANGNLLAPQYFKHLKEMNIQTESFFQSDFFESLNFLQRVLHRLNPNFFYKKVNDTLLKQVKDFQPDILWIFKGMEVFPATLKTIKALGVKIVNYNPDHPFNFVSRGSGNKNVLNSIPFYDLHICYSKKIARDLETLYPNVKTDYLPFGYVLPPNIESRNTKLEILKTGFVGYADKERANFIKFLVDNGVEVDVYGQKWDSFFPNKIENLTVFAGVYGEEYYRTLRKYRVQLNIFRPHNEESHNMRSFEIPAVGGIMLAPRSEEHKFFFTEEKETFFFESKEECLDQINLIIKMNKDAADKIRENAESRSVNSQYDYQGRTKEVLHIFKTRL